MSKIFHRAALLVFLCCFSQVAWSGTEGSITGTVFDNQGVAVSGATVQVLVSGGKQGAQEIAKTTSSATGEYQFFPLTFGDYEVSAQLQGFAPYSAPVHVTSGAATQVDIHLELQTTSKEMVLEVKAKKHLIQHSASVSNTEIGKDQIATLPEGGEISLPKLLSSTTPGAVQGPFGQTFFRGNHANIQYQIDGVQLPDSPSNTFGQAFSPRNIDHMEVITGGIPAEYGERLAAVVNIVTKSGTEKTEGEAEVNYGSYNTVSPHLLLGGSNDSGKFHYFLSGNYNRTDRGLDTPEPESIDNQKQGGTDAVHDQASGNNEFLKMDWLADNSNKFSFVLFNSESSFQIPNYPSKFQPTDPLFQPGFVNQFGNAASYNFTPSVTNDTQFEANMYAQAVWKHTFSERSFLQLAPYWKYSAIAVNNDPGNDLATSPSGGLAQYFPNDSSGNPTSSPSSFAESKHVHNVGLKGDYTLRPDDQNLLKTGFQLQASRAVGSISVQTDLATPAVTDSSPDNGFFESVYLQDDYTISKPLILNAGIRYDATQFAFGGVNPKDSSIQPRIGLNYLVSDTTKLHVFYGKLFQPAPVENLRDTFVNTGGTLAPYDIKAEKDDYWETGVAQQLGGQQVALLNVYYKNATNMLDDAQLLNTSIAQPYNFAKGYAYGVELSLKGQITSDWSDYANYSYEIAKGQSISGGIFAFPAGTTFDPGYQFLDHVQVHTANTGVTYVKNHFWWTTQGLFGSGLRTGDGNSKSLPSHFSADTTVGYEFHGNSWLSKFKLSGDVLNVLDNRYPITVANGFNGSHYAAGREIFLRLSKEL